MSLNKTLLLVDDDTTLRTVLAECLQDLGWTVHVGQDVGDLDRAVAPSIDVVLTDVLMPSGNALTDLESLRSERPDLPILVMSAHNSLSTAMQAAEAGAFDYLAKPFDLDVLTSLVESAWESRTRETTSPPVGTDQSDTFGLIGRSKVMQGLYRDMARVAQTELTVLITGESGTGKELVARALHGAGKRANKPFIAVNMAAIPKDLIESELFGHEKGAFTGAVAKRAGRFAEARGGTLFLDEIGDMPLEAQTRLLRVLQEGQYRIVGASTEEEADVRIMTATHVDLGESVRTGRFREDLFWRLNVLALTVPPLRDRADDIPELIQHFVIEAEQQGLTKKTVQPAALERLVNHSWPGNVRELRNLITRLMVLRAEADISIESLDGEIAGTVPAGTLNYGGTLSEAVTVHLDQYFQSHGAQLPPSGLHPLILSIVERPLIERTLQATKGNQLKAADLLGLNRNTLRKKIRDLGITIEKTP